MPDFQQFQLTQLSNASVTSPRFTISVLITDSKTGATLFDFTGANVITFPGDLPTLLPTTQDKVDFARYIAAYLIQKKAGF